MLKSIDDTSNYTDFLYARPSFLEGLARILDFGNVLQDYNLVEDSDAIRADWLALADDMHSVINVR